MYIFLDEGGDLGFDFCNKKPSTHFVVTLLVCNEHHDILHFKSAVKHTLVNKLNTKKKRNRLVTELKGERTDFYIKEYFYKKLDGRTNKSDWQLYSVIVDKKAILNRLKESIPFNIHRLYNALSYLVLSKIDFSNVKDSVQLSVDSCKTAKERKIFNQYLQSNLEVRLPINVTLNITHELSNNNAGLQVVDMFCWGVFRKYTLNDVKWYDLFKARIAWEGMADF